MESNGFLYVASLNPIFISAARYSAISLKDHWPEAHITLFTHEDWIEEDDKKIFDRICTGTPRHVRAKLWALDKTPYELTCYIDCDTQVHNEDIKHIFEQHDPEANISMSRARAYAASIDAKFPGGELIDHCGLFLYDNKPKTLNFMKEWWNQYRLQTTASEWAKFDKELYPNYLQPWDMFSFWWLQNNTEHKIKRSYFPDPDARWNFIYTYDIKELMGKSCVISHRPVPR